MYHLLTLAPHAFPLHPRNHASEQIIFLRYKPLGFPRSDVAIIRDKIIWHVLTYILWRMLHALIFVSFSCISNYSTIGTMYEFFSRFLAQEFLFRGVEKKLHIYPCTVICFLLKMVFKCKAFYYTYGKPSCLHFYKLGETEVVKEVTRENKLA